MIMTQSHRVYTYLRGGYICSPYTGILLHITVFGNLFSAQMHTSQTNKILVLASLSTSTFMIMTQSQQGVHVLEGWTHKSPLHRNFATYYCVRLPFFGSNGYQLTNTKILVLASLSTSTFMIMTQSQEGVHLLDGRIHTSPLHRHFDTYYTVRLLFFWLKWIPVDTLTQNLGFSIPFNLYIHDHD